MKKKRIEALPFLGLEECSSKKEVLFIGKTARLTIDGVEHVFLEVYRNRKEHKKIPVVRYVMTPKDWGVYEPATGTWSRRKITSCEYSSGLCWYTDEDWIGRGYLERRKANILHSEEDLARIKEFLLDVKVWNDSDWWEYFERQEDDFKHQAWSRKMKRRQDALKERMAGTPELDEAGILEYAENNIFHNKHMLFYKKKGKRATVCCSKCGGVYEGRFQPGESFESQFAKHIEEPREGSTGKCSLCGAAGWYKCQGKARRDYKEKSHIFRVDKYRENGIVARYIEVEKQWLLEECCGDNGLPEMHGAYEKKEGVEIARTYFEQGKKSQTDYQKYDGYRGKNYWDDCNLYGMNNITIGKGVIHPDSWENLTDTEFQYCQMEEYCREVKEEMNILGYLECYRRMPQMEMLIKMGLAAFVKEILSGYEYMITAKNSKRLDSFLGIRKERIPLFLKHKGRIELLRVLKNEKELEQNWTEEQIRKLEELKLRKEDVGTLLRIMTLQKALNIIEKYAGCEYGTGCSKAKEQLRHTATTYIDYLRMRRTLGYDLSNTVYQRPRDLEAAHNLMVAEQDQKQVDKRIAEAEEKFPDIRKNYRKLRNRYFYEDESFLIRPARSAAEIITEGRTLHHCVGGDSYLSKHDKGKTTILLLRIKEEEEIPYITVEIDGTRIIQWYGMHDKKPDKENMDKWLNNYVRELKEKKEQAESKTA